MNFNKFLGACVIFVQVAAQALVVVNTFYQTRDILAPNENRANLMIIPCTLFSIGAILSLVKVYTISPAPVSETLLRKITINLLGAAAAEEFQTSEISIEQANRVILRLNKAMASRYLR